MSQDDAIYLGKFGNSHYRVAHKSGVDEQYLSVGDKNEIASIFGKSIDFFSDFREAFNFAHQLHQSFKTEYGIVFVDTNMVYSDMIKIHCNIMMEIPQPRIAKTPIEQNNSITITKQENSDIFYDIIYNGNNIIGTFDKRTYTITLEINVVCFGDWMIIANLLKQIIQLFEQEIKTTL